MELKYRSLPLSISISYLFLAFLLHPVENVNILVIDGVASPSHHIWMRALSNALAEHGYNVTVLSTKNPTDVPNNLTFLHMPEIYDLDYDFLNFSSMGPFEQMIAFLPMYEPQDEVVLSSTGVKALLEYPPDFKVDLLIYDYLTPYALLGLKEHFNNPPSVAVSPYPGIGMTNLITKGPEFHSFVPHMLKYEIKDCFWDRLENFAVSALYHFAEQYYILPGATKSAQRVMPELQSQISELLLSSRIQMANYHPVIDAVHPILPSVIPVGGLQIAVPKPLPNDLEEIYSMDSSKGSVLFALGSNVKSEDLGKDRLDAIVSAFRDLSDYNFIWKIDAKGLDLDLPKNVFIRDWLPQNDMLADNRTVLFISHAGGLSTQESTWFGVPMLALPVMFDQFPNAERVVKAGMALQLEIREIEKQEFKATIMELLTNKQYTETAKLMSRNFRDQPETPMDRALWWIDYVLRNPDVSFLRSQRLEEMNYLVKHSIDVIAVITLLLLLILLVVGKVFLLIICKWRRKTGGKISSKRKQL